MAKYAQVIADRKSGTSEIVSTSWDDTLLTNNTAEMVRVGFDVFCTREDREYTQFDTGYGKFKFEEGLYERLLREYEIKTGKSLKRW